MDKIQPVQRRYFIPKRMHKEVKRLSRNFQFSEECMMCIKRIQSLEKCIMYGKIFNPKKNVWATEDNSFQEILYEVPNAISSQGRMYDVQKHN